MCLRVTWETLGSITWTVFHSIKQYCPNTAGSKLTLSNLLSFILIFPIPYREEPFILCKKLKKYEFCFLLRSCHEKLLKIGLWKSVTKWSLAPPGVEENHFFFLNDVSNKCRSVFRFIELKWKPLKNTTIVFCLKKYQEKSLKWEIFGN